MTSKARIAPRFRDRFLKETHIVNEPLQLTLSDATHARQDEDEDSDDAEEKRKVRCAQANTSIP